MLNRILVPGVLLFTMFASAAVDGSGQLAGNMFRDNAPDKVAEVETLIRQQLGLIQTAQNEYIRPVRAQDFAVPIRNPFTALPATLQQCMATAGIDLSAMAAYKALYIAGSLSGANARTIINTDPRTILVVGSGTVTHQPIYSRGPVILIGDTHLMSGVYSEDLLWYGTEVRRLGSDPNVGFPVLTSVADPQHSFGVSPYSAEEESNAFARLGSEKTHRADTPTLVTADTRFLPATPRTTIRVPGMDEIRNTAANHRRCGGYAAYAGQQNALNKRYGCGFTGLRWSDDQAGQAKWCMSVLENVSDAENEARSRQLEACATYKAAADNPENQPNIPLACHDPARQFQPVKSIYHAYRYRRELIQPVQGGLITRDYNTDGSRDYIFLEVQGDTAQVTACISDNGGYIRQPSEIRFSVAGDSLEGMQYELLPDGAELKLHIGYLMHDIGDSYRNMRYRYDKVQRAFVITENKAEVTPQYYDGQPAPMREPPAPNMTVGR